MVSESKNFLVIAWTLGSFDLRRSLHTDINPSTLFYFAINFEKLLYWLHVLSGVQYNFNFEPLSSVCRVCEGGGYWQKEQKTFQTAISGTWHGARKTEVGSLKTWHLANPRLRHSGITLNLLDDEGVLLPMATVMASKVTGKCFPLCSFRRCQRPDDESDRIAFLSATMCHAA